MRTGNEPFRRLPERTERLASQVHAGHQFGQRVIDVDQAIAQRLRILRIGVAVGEPVLHARIRERAAAALPHVARPPLRVVVTAGHSETGRMRRGAKVAHERRHCCNRADDRNGRSRQHAQPGRDCAGHEHAHTAGDGLRDAADQPQIAHHRPAGHHTGRTEQRPQPADSAAHGTAEEPAEQTAAGRAACAGDDAVENRGLLTAGHAHGDAHGLNDGDDDRLCQRRRRHLCQGLDEDVLERVHEVRKRIGAAREQLLEHRRPGAVGRIRRALERIGGHAGRGFRIFPVGDDVLARLLEGDALLLQCRLHLWVSQRRFCRIRRLQRIRQPLGRRAHVVERGLALVDDALERAQRRVVTELLLIGRQTLLGRCLLRNRPRLRGHRRQLLLDGLFAVGVGVGQCQADAVLQFRALFAQRIGFLLDAFQNLLVLSGVQPVDEGLPLFSGVADTLVSQPAILGMRFLRNLDVPGYCRARVGFAGQHPLEIGVIHLTQCNLDRAGTLDGVEHLPAQHEGFIDFLLHDALCVGLLGQVIARFGLLFRQLQLLLLQLVIFLLLLAQRVLGAQLIELGLVHRLVSVAAFWRNLQRFFSGLALQLDQLRFRFALSVQCLRFTQTGITRAVGRFDGFLCCFGLGFGAGVPNALQGVFDGDGADRFLVCLVIEAVGNARRFDSGNAALLDQPVIFLARGQRRFSARRFLRPVSGVGFRATRCGLIAALECVLVSLQFLIDRAERFRHPFLRGIRTHRARLERSKLPCVHAERCDGGARLAHGFLEVRASADGGLGCRIEALGGVRQRAVHRI